MCHDNGGALHLLYHMGHGEGLARTGDTQQYLGGQTRLNTFHQLPDSLRLVPRRLVTARNFKLFRQLPSPHPEPGPTWLEYERFVDTVVMARATIPAANEGC